MTKTLNATFVLNKKDFPTFFESLVANSNVFGRSIKNHGESLERIDSLKDLDLLSHNTKISAKGFFFPQTGSLFFFNSESGSTKFLVPETKPNVIFGIRPCDTMAISFLDLVFMGNGEKDPYYAARRSNTILISLACAKPKPTCFCSTVGCNPDSETGADLIFLELNDRYLVKVVSENGDRLMKDSKVKLLPATEEDIQEKESVMKKAKEMLEKNFEVKDLEKKIEDFDASFWDMLHQKCLGCGVCTYLCPTCHCFDITDECHKSLGQRVRTWDSCMFSLFTLHASGHNPRPTQKERMRQRVMHKFNYAVKNYSKTFCVGCGRCVVNCPVNLDIRKVLRQIVEAT